MSSEERNGYRNASCAFYTSVETHNLNVNSLVYLRFTNLNSDKQILGVCCKLEECLIPFALVVPHFCLIVLLCTSI